MSRISLTSARIAESRTLCLEFSSVNAAHSSQCTRTVNCETRRLSERPELQAVRRQPPARSANRQRCSAQLQYCRQQQQQRQQRLYFTIHVLNLREAHVQITGIQYDCSQRRAAEEPHASETAPAANKWTSIRMPP